MRIKPEHYNQIKTAIASIDRNKIKTHAEAVKESGKFKDFGMRMRWDCLHSTGIFKDDFMQSVYSYAHDEHIDTALRNIVAELNIEF